MDLKERLNIGPLMVRWTTGMIEDQIPAYLVHPELLVELRHDDGSWIVLMVAFERRFRRCKILMLSILSFLSTKIRLGDGAEHGPTQPTQHLQSTTSRKS